MALPCEDLVTKTLQNFIELTERPEVFLSVQDKLYRQFRDATKGVYDLSKSSESSCRTASDSSLPELIIQNFDEEQIWQELELQNSYTVDGLMTEIPPLTTHREHLSFCRRKAEKLKEKSQSDSKPSLSHETKNKKSKKINSKDDFLEGVNEDENDNNVLNDSEEDESEEDSDTELKRIKSRLKALEDDDSDENDDELDFDFGNLENELGDPSDQDDLEDDESQEAKINHNHISDVNNQLQVSSPQKQKSKRNRSKGSVVDDRFFKLADMATFLDQEDAREEKEQKRAQYQRGGDEESESESDDEEEIDMFEAFPSDEEEAETGGRKARYQDFFDPPEGADDTNSKTKKKVHFTEEEEKDNDDEEKSDDYSDDDDIEEDDEEDDDDEEDEDDEDDNEDDDNASEEKEVFKERSGGHNLLGSSDSDEGEAVEDILGGKQKDNKSSFEKRQEKLKQKIAQMEDASLEQKSWQLKGEITSASRPENSLLEEHLGFEHTTKLAPVITQETTKNLEDIIIQRIRDKAYDDVERKVKPKDDPFEYKKRLVLDQEKSKQSLGEIYEQEYLKQQKEEEEEKADPDHDEIKKMMQKLFVKLDALSNFHYTPKPAAPELRIVSNLPSIQMEEVAPVSVSDHKMLAPEEVQDKTKGELMAKTEKSVTDRKRDRRKKKKDKKIKNVEREKRQAWLEKTRPDLGKKAGKEKALRGLEKQSKAGGGLTILKENKQKKGGNLASSKTFFTQLQEEVTTQIRSKDSQKRKHGKEDGKSAKKFKL
ncbi:U3 small nucleolar ribonucleoprotein protein MPP10-like [Pecten maximus]|uniref:U3 small nucleolar ribonucleoprotein protein MPP10-like n=1 Tax=Pecten maximus TaxID=6579 RepID=UPI001458EB7B|nr:U3 small nucleolar ribonucleoprotein protein MPP10-like [Pecten maximus]